MINCSIRKEKIMKYFTNPTWPVKIVYVGWSLQCGYMYPAPIAVVVLIVLLYRHIQQENNPIVLKSTKL
jgi:hypothetical protein